MKYREKSRFGSFYTGNSRGHAEVCLRTGRLFFTHGDAVKILDQSNGQTIHTISLEGDIVSALSLSPDGTVLVIATKLGFLRQYTSSDFELVRTWKSTHIGPVRLLAFDSTSTFVASGGSDGTVKVWDQRTATDPLDRISVLKFFRSWSGDRIGPLDPMTGWFWSVDP